VQKYCGETGRWPAAYREQKGSAIGIVERSENTNEELVRSKRW
jgi:hypothetical protein